MKKYIALLIVLLLIAIPYWAVKHPQQTWNGIQKHFLPKDLKITWSDMDFKAKHLSGLNFYFNFKIQNLVIQKEKPAFDLPVDLVQVEASVYPRSQLQKITLHNLVLQSSKTLRFRPENKKEKAPELNPFEQAQGIFSKISKINRLAKIENADIEVTQFDLEQSDTSAAKISLSARKQAELNTLKYKTEFKISELSVSSIGKLILEDADKVKLQGIIDANGFGAQVRQNIFLVSTSQITQIDLEGSLKYSKNKFKISSTPHTSLKMTAESADLNLHSDIVGLNQKMIKIRPFEFKLHAPFTRGKLLSREASDLDLVFPIEIFIAEARMKSPEVINGHLLGKIWISNLLSTSNEKQKTADLHLSFHDFKNDLLFIKATADLVVFKQQKSYTFAPMIDASAKLNSFQKLRHFLDSKRILIPAPLDALEGSVTLVMKGPVQSQPDKYVFPAEIAVKLASNKQIFDVTTTSSVNLGSNFKSAHADIHAVIRQVRLLLPPLNPIDGKPRVVPDRRILKQPKIAKANSKFQFTYSLSVETRQPGAIQLLSDYFDPFLPLTLNFKSADSSQSSGAFNIEPFTVEYLRRKVHVEKFSFDIANTKTKPIVINGRLRVDQTEYTIFIDVTGTADKPHVILSSQPYLPRSEIISVLLYDRTTGDLIAADAETAGQVEAAVADRAIGLIGIWAFASTPIRGFSYNPTTKVYTATLQLPDNVVASVGTNLEESTQVELRKRISRRWVITAAWTPTDQNENELTKLVLQWEKRF